MSENEKQEVLLLLREIAKDIKHLNKQIGDAIYQWQVEHK